MTVKHQYPSVTNSVSTHSAHMWTPAQTTYSTDTLSTPSDLVSLAWLQKGDIIQIAPLDGEEEPARNTFVTVNEDGNLDLPPATEVQNFPPAHMPPSKLTLNVNFPDAPSRPSSTSSEIYSPHCPVDQPQLSNYTSLSGQGLAKPNYSYTHLIFMAIESTPQKCMTVNQIYNWCESNFPFYKHAGGGWKNSLRHNLSINKSFKRLPRDSRRELCDFVKCRSPYASCSSDLEHDELEDDEGPGRGAFWTVEPRERANLLDAIKRNPWNFNNLASLVSSAHGCDGNSSVLFNTPYLLTGSMRKFSLTNSAPGSLLRNSLGEPIYHDELLQHLDTDSPMATLTGPATVESILNLPPGTIHLMSTPDGRLIATCGGAADGSDLVNGSADGDADNATLSLTGNYDGMPTPKSTVLPDSRYWLSPDSNKPGRVSTASDMKWSNEEEEKYLQTLETLLFCERLGSPCNGGPHGDTTKTSADGFTSDDAKHATKQRRKSRLLPTRAIDDSTSLLTTFPLAHTMGKCNECKENATSGCESCHAINFSVPSSETESLLTEIINTLDSDQEHGPAGGPLTRRSTVKATASSPARTADSVAELDGLEYKCSAPPSSVKSEEDHCGGGEVAQSGMQLDDTKVNLIEEEVYVTPAAYLDHEYAHCQAQLRVPWENQLVNRYNEMYCSEALNQLAKTRPFLKHPSVGGIRLRGRNVEVHSREDADAYVEYMDTNEDDLSETNDDEDDDDDGFNQADEGGQDSNTEPEEEEREGWTSRPDERVFTSLGDVAQSKGQQRKVKAPAAVYQQRRSGIPRRRGRGHAVDRLSQPLGERALSAGKRGRRGRRWSHPGIAKRGIESGDSKHFVTRRSKRVVRAPRRLYDDFEDSLSIDPYSQRTNEMGVGELYQSKQMEGNVDASKKVRRIREGHFTRADYPAPGSGRRGRQRGRCRGVHRRRLYSPLTNGRDHLNDLEDCTDLADQSDVYSESDEEREYLHLAAARQRQTGILFPPNDGDVNPLKSLYTYTGQEQQQHPVERPRGRPRTVAGSVGIGAMWSQSRLTMARKLAAAPGNSDSPRQPAGDGLSASNDSSGKHVTDCHGTSERTTVEAAQLLFGISQMQNFRRQSGYISLDSSRTSGNSSYDSMDEAGTPHKPSNNGLAETTECPKPARSPVTSSPVALINT